MCLKDDRGEGLSNPAVGDGQCVEQNKRDRHEEQHDTHKVRINLPQRERASTHRVL
jgi:hypothetical protein